MAERKKIMKHGGPRKGAGRKPASDPKIAIMIYIEESIVKKLGGVEVVKNECYDFLKKSAKE